MWLQEGSAASLWNKHETGILIVAGQEKYLTLIKVVSILQAVDDIVHFYENSRVGGRGVVAYLST